MFSVSPFLCRVVRISLFCRFNRPPGLSYPDIEKRYVPEESKRVRYCTSTPNTPLMQPQGQSKTGQGREKSARSDNPCVAGKRTFEMLVSDFCRRRQHRSKSKAGDLRLRIWESYNTLETDFSGLQLFLKPQGGMNGIL